MNITREQAKSITEKLAAAAKQIFAEEGLESGKISTHFGERYDFKIVAEALELGVNGVNLKSEYAAAHQKFAEMFGVSGVELGTEFDAQGKKYFYAGIAVSRSKYPFYAIDANGKGIFFTEALKVKLNQSVGAKR